MRAKDVLGMVGAGMVGSLLTLGLVGAQRPSQKAAGKGAAQAEVKARAFTLVDGGGKALARLADAEGGPQFTLNGPNGLPVIALKVSGDDQGLVIVGSRGGNQAGIGIFPDSPSLMLSAPGKGSVQANVVGDQVNIQVIGPDRGLMFKAVR